MEKEKSWFEEESFWTTFDCIMFGEKRMSGTAGEIDKLVFLLGLTPGDRVLDLCCGIGRHSIELAKRGFVVTGVDMTTPYLEKAKEKAKAEKLKIKFVQEDMRKFCKKNSFDCCVNLFTSFGYFKDPEEDRQVLTNVYQSLKPGGKFLMDFLGKEILAKNFRERDWYEENGIMFLEERKLSEDWSWIDTRWMLIKGSEIKEATISLRLYSAAEIKSLALSCGFSKVNIYGDLAAAPYDHNAKRLIVAAYK